MKFGTKGTIKTENLLEVTLRCIAQLQEAGIENVSGINLYLSPVDKKGRKRSILKDGNELDHIRLDIDDLLLPEPKSEITSVYTDEHIAKTKSSYSHPIKRASRGR